MSEAQKLIADLYFNHFYGNSDFQKLLDSAGFADRRLLNDAIRLSEKHSERIKSAYWKAILDQRHLHPFYSASNEWVPIFRGDYGNAYGKLIEALKAYDYLELSNILSNFWREPCSAGILGPGFEISHFFGQAPFRELSQHHWEARQVAVEIFYRYQLLHTLTQGSVDDFNLQTPNFGNQFGFYINNNIFLPGGCDYQFYYADRIKSIIYDKIGLCAATVAELGPGYGGVAFYLSTLLAKGKIILFDMPLVLTMASANLLETTQNSEVLLFDEVGSSSLSSIKNEISLLPSFAIEDIGDESVDVWFNSYSLAEMSPNAINNYLAHIGRTLKPGGYFLNVNHSRNCIMGSLEFPYAEYQMKICTSSPTLWNLMRHGRGDEIEVLCVKEKSQLFL
jgi:hypothetical protein